MTLKTIRALFPNQPWWKLPWLMWKNRPSKFKYVTRLPILTSVSPPTLAKEQYHIPVFKDGIVAKHYNTKGKEIPHE